MINQNELRKARKLEFKNMDNDDYHNDIGLSSSNIKLIIKDVDKYKYELEFPPKKTEALIFGTRFDELIFEEEKFEKKYHIIDTGSKGSKAFKDAVKNYPDKEILKKSEMELINSMNDELLDNKIFTDIMKGAETQLSFFTHEAFSGMILKVRLDILKNDYIWDLKTCADIDDYSIKKAINNFGYDISLGVYTNVISKFRPISGAGWIFISKSKPHQIRILAMPELHFNHAKEKALEKSIFAHEILLDGRTTYDNKIVEFDYHFGGKKSWR